jgi:hypothetical protein
MGVLSSIRSGRRVPVPFVVGMNRSGTTLLRLMLDAHPIITVPPETHFVPDLIEVAKAEPLTPDTALGVIVSQREWGDFGLGEEELAERLRAGDPLEPGDAIRAFFELYAEKQDKPRWGDKTPRYVTRMRAIGRKLPEAHFIHVIRDGRDVALSVIDRTVKDLTFEAVATRWKHKVESARKDAPFLDHYMEVRYEDLILDTEPTLRRICEFIDLEWDDAVLHHHEGASDRLAEMARELPAQQGKTRLSVERRLATHAKTTEPPDPERVSRWRTKMSAEDRAEFEGVAGELLAELGYETLDGKQGADGQPPVALKAPRPAGVGKRLWMRAAAAGRRLRESRTDRGIYRAPSPFIVGTTRSGSTLLRLMLDAHPEMAIPSETHFLPDLIKAYRWERASAAELAEVVIEHRRWGDFQLEPDELRERFAAVDPLSPGNAIRAFFELYAEKQGKPRWGDKTPGYVREMLRIQSVLREAHFIHLIRDGRDVALSMLGMSWGPSTVEDAARRWRKRVLRAREQVPRTKHYIEVRFEDLLTDTEGQLRRVCDYIDLPFDDVMLDYHERASERLQEKARDLDRGPDRPPVTAEHRMRSHKLTEEPPDPERIARWRTDMEPEDQAKFEEIAGDLLNDLGYEISGTASPLPAGQRIAARTG